MCSERTLFNGWVFLACHHQLLSSGSLASKLAVRTTIRVARKLDCILTQLISCEELLCL